MELISLTSVLRFAAAMLFVLGLMGGLALVMRKFGHGAPITGPGKRRLKIVETMALDHRRRLFLIQRDDREHLIILGSNGETVVESGIESRQDEVSNKQENNENSAS
ncbi:MAG: FliO/MopB family protein [Rhodospirillales bacterium]|nr:FliO/MopB family protein [Rhodospirillales bacterium]